MTKRLKAVNAAIKEAVTDKEKELLIEERKYWEGLISPPVFIVNGKTL